MSITFFCHLDNDQRKKVFEQNEALKQDVFSAMWDDAFYWCGEYLKCWNGGIDYSVGYDRGTYFRSTNTEKFLDGLEKAQHDYGFLADSYNNTIAYVRKLCDRLEYVDYNYPDDITNYQRIEARIDQLVNELCDACHQRFTEEYEPVFDEESQFDYFLSCYVDNKNMESNSFYVDENYTLFEHVAYEKSYK